MEYLIAGGTLGVATLFAVTYFLGRRHGYALGVRAGRESAKTDLLLMKDPEAWNLSRTLVIDDLERAKTEQQEKTTTRLRRTQSARPAE